MAELDATLDLSVEPALASLAAVESAGVAALENIASTGVDVSVALDTTQLDEAASALAAFVDPAVTVSVDFGQVDEAASALAGLDSPAVTVDVDASAVEAAAAALDVLADAVVSVTVDVDTAAVEGAADVLAGLSVVPVVVEFDVTALDEVAAAIEGLASVVPVVVEVDASGLESVAVEDQTVTVTVDVDSSALDGVVDAAAAAGGSVPVVVDVDGTAVEAAATDIAALASTVAVTVDVDVSAVDSAAVDVAALAQTVTVIVDVDDSGLEGIGGDAAVSVELDADSLAFAELQIAELGAAPVVVSVELDDADLAAAGTALAGLAVDPVVVDVDTTAVDAAAGDVAALGDTPVTVVVDADTSGLDDVDAAVGGLPDTAEVTVTVDTSDVVEGADTIAGLSSIEVEPVVVTVDTSDVTAATADVEGLAEAASAVEPPDVSGGGLAEFSQQADQATESTRSLTTASDNFTAFALGSSGAIKGALTSISPTAAAATAAVGTFFYTAFQGAAEAETALWRFTDVFGQAGEVVDTIDIGGLNVSLEELAIQLGADDDKVRIAAAGLGALGVQAGATQTEVAGVAEQFVAVASYLSATNPALGTTENIMARLGPALIRGGAAASRLGLSFSAAEQAARAQEIALARGSDQVNAYDKQAAGLALTVEKLGDKLGTSIERGTDRADVRLRSFRQQVEEAVEGAGKALLDPGLALGEELFGTLAAVIDLVGESAAKVVPLFAGAVHALGLGVGALEPLLGLLEDVPAPVLQAGVVFLALSKTLPGVASLLGGVAGKASTAADKLHLFGTAGRLDSLSTGARNVSGLAAASGSAERAAFKLEAGLRAQDRAAIAGSLSAGRLAGAERASALAATGASTAQVASARALTAKELSAIGAAGGLGALTVQERLAAVATLAHAGDVKGTQLALASLGVTTTVTKTSLQGVAVAAETAGAATVAAGTAAKGAGLSFGAMLGPLTLILTAGFTLAQMFGVFEDEVDSSGEAVDAWRNTLKSAGDEMTNAEAAARLTSAEIGRIGDNASRNAGVKKLEDDLADYIDTLSEAGLTTGDYFDAIDSGGGALVTFRQRLIDTGAVALDLTENTESTRAAQEAFGEEFVRSGDNLKSMHAAARALGGDLFDLARVTEDGVIRGGELADSIGEQSEAYEKVRGSILKAAAAEIESGNAANTANIRRAAENGWLDKLTPKQREMAGVLVEGAAALDRQAKGLDAGATAAEKKAEADDKAKEAAEELAQAYDDLDTALSDATDAFRDFLGIPLTAAEQQFRFAQDTLDLAATLAENGLALDAAGVSFERYTEAGQKNFEVFAEVAKRGLDSAIAIEKTAGGAAGAAAEIDKYRTAVVNAAVAAGASAEEANVLADSLGLIRGRTFSAEVEVDGLKEAREVQEALQIGLGLLSKPAVAVLKMDGFVEAKETVDAVALAFRNVPPEKRTKFAVDFAEMLDALGVDDELRTRPDIEKIVKYATDDEAANLAYNVLAARPDVEHFLRMNPDFGAAYTEYQTAEKLADLQKRFHIDDAELAAFVADYRKARDAPDINKRAEIETRVSAVSVANANRELEGFTRQYREAIVDVRVRAPSILGIDLGIPQLIPQAHGGILDDDDEEHLAQIARAGAMRVWAEPETGGEAYIPLAPAKRPRSSAILAEVADRFGYALAPERPVVAVSVPAGFVSALSGLRDAVREESDAARRLVDVQPVVTVEAPDMSGVVRSNESVAAAVSQVARSIEGQRRPGNVDQSRTVNIGRIEHRTQDARWLDDLAALLR